MRTPTNSLPSSLGRRLVLPALAVLAAVLLLPATPAFAGGACPNEQLRRESNINPNTGEPYDLSLPDCRAYEQVSPVSKEGATVTPQYVSEDGGSLAFNSTGAMAGSLGRGALDNEYTAQRTSEGWSTTAEDASPTSEFDPSNTEREDENDTLSRQVWFGSARGTSLIEYAIREGDGTFLQTHFGGTESGTGPSYDGASQSLETVVFNAGAGAKLLPVDPGTPAGLPGGLYQITGAGTGSPALSYVAVSNSGSALGTSAVVPTLGSTYFGHSEGTHSHAISRSGSKIFFDVAPSASYNGDTNTQVFARIDNTETIDLSEPTATECSACVETTPKADAYAGASAEGEKVFFTTEQELLPGQTGKNIYEYDFNEPVGHRIVLVSAGLGKPEVQGVIRISNDGSHVYFVAQGKLTSQQNKEGEEAHTGAENMYVFEQDEAHPAGQVTFVADLCSGSGESGTVTDTRCPAASTATDAALWATTDDRPAQATPEGRYLVFQSVADLTAGDTSTVAQVFRYDAETGDIERISTGEEGYSDNGNTASDPASIHAPEADLYGARAGFENSLRNGRAISDNGDYIIFTTADALSPRDTNNATDVYEWHEGHVSLISDGVDPYGSEYLMMTPTGEDIFFGTRDSLVPQDTDTELDVYDARMNRTLPDGEVELAGFPAPTPPSPGCSGEACQPLSALFTPPGPSGSSTQAAGENLAPTATTTTTTTTTTKTTKPKALTKAQKLAKALKVCGKDRSKARRKVCEATARKRYAPVKQSKKKASRKKR